MIMPDITISIDKVFCWPISVIIGVPEGIVIIEYDWIFDVVVFYSLFDIRLDMFKSKLGSMDTDNHESLITIFFIPFDEVWKGSLTVDTRVGPEVYKDDFPFELLHREGIRVDPVLQASQFWSRIRMINGEEKWWFEGFPAFCNDWGHGKV